MSKRIAFLLVLALIVQEYAMVLSTEQKLKKKHNMLTKSKEKHHKDLLPKVATPFKTTAITEDGKLREQAEASLLTLSMKFVNFNTYQSTGEVLKMFTYFNDMRKGHTMITNTKTIEEFNSRTDDIKVDTCKLYLNDSLLKFNELRYDDTAESKEILFTEKTVKYRHYKKYRKSEIVLQCPIRYKYEKKGYIYFSVTEHRKYSNDENSDTPIDVFYYIFTDYTYPPSSVISVLMRAKLQKAWNVKDTKTRITRYLAKLWYWLTDIVTS